MGNMKELDVSGDVFHGSISFSHEGFEDEPLFPANTGSLSAPLSLVRGARPWSAAAASGVKKFW